jgi:hypothetical protein
VSTTPKLVPSAAPGLVPLEAGQGRWIARCRQTLVAMLARPGRTFDLCPEPIDHGRVLRFMATLRLPPWIVLLVTLSIRKMSADVAPTTTMRSIYVLVEPELAQVLSAWIVLMVPVGLPLLYFVSGLVAHIGVALTGGAPRSIGASMRAVGYAMTPALFVVALLDLGLYLGDMPATIYLGTLGAVALLNLWLVAWALARTHRVSVARGFLVGILPVLVLVAVTLGRAALELGTIPGFPEPSSPYYVP